LEFDSFLSHLRLFFIVIEQCRGLYCLRLACASDFLHVLTVIIIIPQAIESLVLASVTQKKRLARILILIPRISRKTGSSLYSPDLKRLALSTCSKCSVSGGRRLIRRYLCPKNFPFMKGLSQKLYLANSPTHLSISPGLRIYSIDSLRTIKYCSGHINARQ
jgi:hypothetical protein